MTSPSKKPNQEQTQLPFSKDSAPAQSASPKQLCGAFRELKNDERHVTEAWGHTSHFFPSEQGPVLEWDFPWQEN